MVGVGVVQDAGPTPVRDLTLIPDPVSLDGWQTAFNELDPSLPRLFLNSTIIAAAVTLTNVILGSMAGYAFARLRFPGREILFILVLGTMMIPDQLRLVPIYQILHGPGPAPGRAPVPGRGPRARRSRPCRSS